MASQGKKYRVIYLDEGGLWQIKECNTKLDATAWTVGHPGALIVRYIVASPAGMGNTSFDTLEEALASGGNGSEVRPKVDGKLNHTAVEVLFLSLKP